MKNLTVFLLGALVGGVATAFLTPVTGAELRARVRIQLQKHGIIEPDRLDELVEYIAAQIEASSEESGK